MKVNARDGVDVNPSLLCVVQRERADETFKTFQLHRTALNVKPCLTQSERFTVPQEVEVHPHLCIGRLIVIAVASSEAKNDECNQGKCRAKRGADVCHASNVQPLICTKSCASCATASTMKSPTSFEVVRASAGSGKTYRLVSRYLACCLGPRRP